MPAPTPCVPHSCCADEQTVNIPGLVGQSAFTTTTAIFTVPALAGSVTIQVENSEWAAIGQSVFIPGAGTFTITGIPDTTHITLSYDDIPANTSAGFVMSDGLIVTPTGKSSNGTDGVNAYTFTTADFTVPAIGANVAISVAANEWMVVGQQIFVEGAGYFEVISKAGTTSVTAEYSDVDSNTNAGNNIVSGAAISPGGVNPPLPVSVANGGTGQVTIQAAATALGLGATPLSVYAAGTAYPLTNTAALLDFGTTDPSLVISAAGIYALFARVRIDYTAATFAAVRNVTIKIRRTNNTAADITNSSVGFKTDIITTLTYTAQIVTIPVCIYTTTNADDILQLWGSIDTVPSAGSIDAVEASLIAVRIRDQTL